MDQNKRPTLSLRPARRVDTPPTERTTSPHERPTRELDCLAATPQSPSSHARFGEWLVRRGVLTREQLLRALATSHLHDWRIGDAAVVLGLARRARIEAEAERFLALQAWPDPRRRRLERQACGLEREARRARAMGDRSA